MKTRKLYHTLHLQPRALYTKPQVLSCATFPHLLAQAHCAVAVGAEAERLQLFRVKGLVRVVFLSVFSGLYLSSLRVEGRLDYGGWSNVACQLSSSAYPLLILGKAAARGLSRRTISF